MDSKDSSPKTVLPFVCLRNLPAVAPKPQGRLRPLMIAATGSAGDNFNFFKLNAFTLMISKRDLEMTFASHRH